MVMTPTPKLNAALAAFQAELPKVPKDARAHIPGRDAYEYADIEDMSSIVLPLLGKHGLSFSAMPLIRDDGKRVLRYALLHSSGEERGGDFELPGNVNAQGMGSAITYARRYTLGPITGVAPGSDDDDGKAASDAHAAPPVESRRDETPLEQPLPFATATVAHFKRLGITDRDVQLGYIAALTGHAVTTPRDLTADEKTALLEVLSKCKNREALDQQAKQEETTA
jgi:hypothetical protein